MFDLFFKPNREKYLSVAPSEYEVFYDTLRDLPIRACEENMQDREPLKLDFRDVVQLKEGIVYDFTVKVKVNGDKDLQLFILDTKKTLPIFDGTVAAILHHEIKNRYRGVYVNNFQYKIVKIEPIETMIEKGK